MLRFATLILAASLLACSSDKVLPDGSMLGTMTTQQLPIVSMDGKEMRLAPGARIVNVGNLSITPNQVPAASRVRYKLDAAGQISQIWILPPEAR
jgi:hypothetical protein